MFCFEALCHNIGIKIPKTIEHILNLEWSLESNYSASVFIQTMKSKQKFFFKGKKDLAFHFNFCSSVAEKIAFSG